MNCKPGDLAVIVKSRAGNEGRFVEVVNGDVERLPGDLGMASFGPLWRVRSYGSIRSSWGWLHEEFAFPDAWLRPIRNPGEDAKDETLQWKEVPAKQKEPA